MGHPYVSTSAAVRKKMGLSNIDSWRGEEDENFKSLFYEEHSLEIAQFSIVAWKKSYLQLQLAA